MAKVMFKMIALVFQGIERFIFYFPSGSTRLHQLNDIVFGYSKIGDPAIVICGLLAHL